ncbi:protein rep [Helicobacter ailurogastricus]|uniref:Uncharacterized protein n=1 Tax=Helicobacter ailurogastricus TaxID=1578720 RepID=A0A0K2XEH2_9HELI|nr:protein rep [Helicobacter ailurogastricus]CRF41334.1 hypothetical protein HAL011_11260 [Helicobacter ailurogastricus]CRF42554.1 hypothetical protein HAL013_07460 [Helicobacter ailurogastricus]CRF44867.1 hypothetical protein HAL09_14850 [Helicobacter ailurogastricus]
MNTSPQPLKTCLEPSTALEKATAKRVSLKNQSTYSLASHFLRDVAFQLSPDEDNSNQGLGTACNPAIGTIDNPLTLKKGGNPNYTKHHLGKIKRKTFFSRAKHIELCNATIIETTHKNGTLAIPHGFSCKDKLCYTCNSIKAHKHTIKYQQAIANLILNSEISLENLRLIMITLSPPNVAIEDTRNTTKALNAVVHTLLTKKSLLRFRTAPEGVWGYIRGTEWTGNNFHTQLAIGKTHPHVHLLLLTDWAYYTDETADRYIDQKKHELTQMVKEQIKHPIAITDYNSNEKDKDGNPIPVPIEVNIADCHVHVEIVFDGRDYIDPKSKKCLEPKMHNAIFEIVKGFKFDSADEGIDPQALEQAKSFCNDIKAKSKKALDYKDKGALSPEHIRKLGTMDREKNRKYQEAKELHKQGKISQEQLDEHEFKPYFMMFCEQVRGLRTFGSGGVFAKCKLEQAFIDSPPEQARIIRYDAKPAEQLKLEPPKGKDKKKTLGQRIHDQIGYSNCTLEPPQTALKGNECALFKQAYDIELSSYLTCEIDETLERLSPEQKADKKEVLTAIKEVIQAYQATFEGKDDEGNYQSFRDDCPEFIDSEGYAYSITILYKAAYAYATDKLNNGLSVFSDEQEQEKAISALTAKSKKRGQHVREKSTSGKRATSIEPKAKKFKNEQTKDFIMESLNLTIPQELLAQFQALEQDCQEQPAAIEQWALKALKWALNRKYCKKCYYPMQRKTNSKDNSIFWKCSNQECSHKEQFDDMAKEQKAPEYLNEQCPKCGSILKICTNPKTGQDFIGCSRYNPNDPSKHCGYSRALNGKQSVGQKQPQQNGNHQPQQQQPQQQNAISQPPQAQTGSISQGEKMAELQEQIAQLTRAQEMVMEMLKAQSAKKANEINVDDDMPF